MVQVTDNYFSSSIGNEIIAIFASNGLTVFQTSMLTAASDSEILTAYSRMTAASNIRSKHLQFEAFGTTKLKLN